MSDGKRKRSPNWLFSEKQLLLDLVEKHFSVIENKKTDGVTMKGKLAEWQAIANEYNSATTHCHRGADNLKAQWESMKKAAKKEASKARMLFLQTGGGPPETKKEDPEQSRIISLIKTSAVGLFNPFDGDSVVPATNEKVPSTQSESENITDTTCNIDIGKLIGADQPLMEVLENNDMAVELNVDANDWGDYTPKLLRTPVSTPLQVFDNKEHTKHTKHRSIMSRRRPTCPASSSSSIEQYHTKKIKAIDLQYQLAKEERSEAERLHTVEMEIKKEVLKQEKMKTRLLLLELRLKKKQMKNIVTHFFV